MVTTLLTMLRNFWDTEVLDGILEQKGRRRKRARGKRKSDVSRIANNTPQWTNTTLRIYNCGDFTFITNGGDLRDAAGYHACV